MSPRPGRSAVAPRFVSELAREHASGVLERRRAQLARSLPDPKISVPDDKFHDDVSEVDAAWAAGLFVGEGWVGATYRSGLPSVDLSVGMLDERSVNRFARLFDRRVYVEKLGYDASRVRLVARACGRSAEGVLRVLWPHIVGTDKGDQARDACLRAGVLGWVDGTATTPRPARRERGRSSMSPQTKDKIAAAQRARWERQRRG